MEKIDFLYGIPQELAVNASYSGLLTKVRALEALTERDAETLDYIFRTRLCSIIKLDLFDEAGVFTEFLERVLHARHHHKHRDVAGVNYLERWLGYKAIIEDAISVMRGRREHAAEKRDPDLPDVNSIFDEFAQRATLRMAKTGELYNDVNDRKS